MAKRGGSTDSCCYAMALSGPSHATGNTLSSANGVRVPTIRVRYIDAPKIVTTDVANFRSIVQQLTGKQSWENSATPAYEPVHGKFTQKSCDDVIRTIQSCKIPSFHQPKRACLKSDYYKNNTVPSLTNQDDFCMRDNEKRSLRRGPLCMQDRFSDQDIIAGLVSGEPLPDLTMLPPLVEDIAS